MKTLLNSFESSKRPGKVVTIRRHGVLDYLSTLKKMQKFAAERTDGDPDEIWLLEHDAVYTQGTSCQSATLMPSDIAVIKTDRGGQITYHGRGQIVMYPLLKLSDHKIGVRDLVGLLEQAAINTLAEFGLSGERRDDAPGIYINHAKIAALGLRIKRGTSYHGLSLNVNMDLTPFLNIDPCGYQGLQVTQLSALVESSARSDLDTVREMLLRNFLRLLD